MKVYKREYDQPLDSDGTEKPNEYLGEYDLIEILEEDAYSSLKIVADKVNRNIFLLVETEVSGRFHNNGGSRYELKPLKTLQLA